MSKFGWGGRPAVRQGNQPPSHGANQRERTDEKWGFGGEGSRVLELVREKGFDSPIGDSRMAELTRIRCVNQ